jgi:hypothetical protein
VGHGNVAGKEENASEDDSELVGSVKKASQRSTIASDIASQRR